MKSSSIWTQRFLANASGTRLNELSCQTTRTQYERSMASSCTSVSINWISFCVQWREGRGKESQLGTESGMRRADEPHLPALLVAVRLHPVAALDTSVNRSGVGVDVDDLLVLDGRLDVVLAGGAVAVVLGLVVAPARALLGRDLHLLLVQFVLLLLAVVQVARAAP